MSRYAVNKVLWQVARDDDAAAMYIDSPAGFLAGRALTDEEHRQLSTRDYAALFASGAPPVPALHLPDQDRRRVQLSDDGRLRQGDRGHRPAARYLDLIRHGIVNAFAGRPGRAW